MFTLGLFAVIYFFGQNKSLITTYCVIGTLFMVGSVFAFVIYALATASKIRLQETQSGTAPREIKLPAFIRNRRGRRFTSGQSFLGLPLIHINVSDPPQRMGEKIEPSVAQGWIAVGDHAYGLIALGNRAFGALAFGGIAVGGLTIGGLSLGVVALGGGAVGLFTSIGGGALGFLAVGGLALGYYALEGFRWAGMRLGDSQVAMSRREDWLLATKLLKVEPLTPITQQSADLPPPQMPTTKSPRLR